MTDRVMQHGRSLAGLAPSTYEATLATTLAIGYPTGSLMPLGIGHQLLAYDSAWLYQPYLAFLAALLALALYAVLARVDPVAAGCAPLRRSSPRSRRSSTATRSGAGSRSSSARCCSR